MYEENRGTNLWKRGKKEIRLHRTRIGSSLRERERGEGETHIQVVDEIMNVKVVIGQERWRHDGITDLTLDLPLGGGRSSDGGLGSERQDDGQIPKPKTAQAEKRGHVDSDRGAVPVTRGPASLGALRNSHGCAQNSPPS